MVDEELTGAGEEMGAPSGGNMKTIIIIAAIAIVMAAIGFFAGKMFTGGGDNGEKAPVEQKTDAQAQQATTNNAQPQQKSGNNDSESTEESGDAQNGDGAVQKKDNRGVLALDTFTVNLNDPFGRRYIEVVFNLIVNDKSLVPKIKENELVMPQIRHEIFMTVSSKSYAELKSTSGKVTLHEEIMMRVNEILKEEMGVEPVIQVLHTKFLIQ